MSAWERVDALHWLVDYFRKPSALTLAQRELEECERSLLEHERARDYHDNMVAFNRRRMSSLKTMIMLRDR